MPLNLAAPIFILVILLADEPEKFETPVDKSEVMPRLLISLVLIFGLVLIVLRVISF